MKYALLAIILIPALSLAVPVQTPVSPANVPVNQASDASFDKRLPPVLPGERMNDSGHEMRVWSTAGEVPVSQAPEPFKDKQLIDDFVSNKGIIVDDRGPGRRGPGN